jgi:phosphoribosyl-AMP cyclohydrolase
MSHTPHLEEGKEFLPQYNQNGLITVVTIDWRTKDVLMLAYANQEAIDLTLQTGLAHYFSRSRQKIWQKGKESGFIQKVKRVLVDCDQDALVYEVEPVGGVVCHTGRQSCFYREIDLTQFAQTQKIELLPTNK